MPVKRKTTLSIHFTLAGAGALVCLAWLLAIPKDAKNAIVWGLSAARLGLAAILLAGMLISVGLVVFRSRAPEDWEHKIQNFLPGRRWAVLFGLLILCLLAGLGLLWLPPDRLDSFQYAFARLKPLIAWLTLIAFQGVVLLAEFYYQRNPPDYATIHADFSASAARLPTAWKFIPALIGGGLAGASLALLIRPTGSEIFHLLPWLPGVVLAFGLGLLVAGLLYNRSLVAAVPYGFAVLLLAGAITNLWMGQADAQRFRAELRSIPDNDAVTLGNQYHYSLSVYHVLSKFYPGSRMVVAPGVLKEWNLTENQLKEWVPLAEIQERAYDPILSDAEAQQILELNPVELEVNTSAGTHFYYFLPEQKDPSKQIVLLVQEKKRFILPVSRFNQLFPQRKILN